MSGLADRRAGGGWARAASGLGASLALHAAGGLAVLALVAPEPVPDQPRAEARMELETAALARRDASERRPEAGAAGAAEPDARAALGAPVRRQDARPVAPPAPGAAVADAPGASPLRPGLAAGRRAGAAEAAGATVAGTDPAAERLPAAGLAGRAASPLPAPGASGTASRPDASPAAEAAPVGRAALSPAPSARDAEAIPAQPAGPTAESAAAAGPRVASADPGGAAARPAEMPTADARLRTPEAKARAALEAGTRPVAAAAPPDTRAQPAAPEARAAVAEVPRPEVRQAARPDAPVANSESIAAPLSTPAALSSTRAAAESPAAPAQAALDAGARRAGAAPLPAAPAAGADTAATPVAALAPGAAPALASARLEAPGLAPAAADAPRQGGLAAAGRAAAAARPEAGAAVPAPPRAGAARARLPEAPLQAAFRPASGEADVPALPQAGPAPALAAPGRPADTSPPEARMAAASPAPSTEAPETGGNVRPAALRVPLASGAAPRPPGGEPAPEAEAEAARIAAALEWSGAGEVPLDPQSLATLEAFLPEDARGAAGEEVRDGIAALMASLPCARVHTAFDPDTGALELRGHVPDAAMREPLAAALRARIGPALPVRDALRLLPEPQCGVLAGLDGLGLPQSEEQFTDPHLVGETGWVQDYAFAGGERLVIDLEAPDYPAYVYVDYYMADGTVLHLMPNAQVPLEQHAAAAPVSVGRAAGLELRIAPPYGQDIAVAIATESPLYQGVRPVQEPAEAYLAFLRERLEALGEVRGEWAYLFVTTRAPAN